MSERTAEFRSTPPSLLESAQAFLYRESRLLDDGKFEEWVDLFTEDGLYWMPSNELVVDPSKHVCVVYADKARLGEFVVRARSGTFWAQEPPSRVSRLIGNVELDQPLPDCRVLSRFVVTEIRRGRLRVFSGACRHRLVWRDGGWKIREKLVKLINNDEPLDNLTFMI